MAPSGWLDVHTHFFQPLTDEQADGLVAQLRDAYFHAQPCQLHWRAEEIIGYNDRAGIQMSLLSYIPRTHQQLREANDFGHSVVKKYPTRFGQLAALPTDDGDACFAEINRVEAFNDPPIDGFSTCTVYNGVPLSDPRLDKVWEYLNNQDSVVHIHPNAYAAGEYQKPSALIDVAFDTARVATDMLYKGVFRRYPRIKFIFAHCGGALPALSGRLRLLGTDPWVPNPQKITRTEMEQQLSNLYIDTAATAKTGLAPAANMVGIGHCLYGSDCGVPCSNERSMNENLQDVKEFERKVGIPAGTIVQNTWSLFPAAAKRADQNVSSVNGVH